jgi:hypothetical protein
MTGLSDKASGSEQAKKTGPSSKLVTIYWRDIPAQVNAQVGRTRTQVVLHQRFQVAIDRAAMIAGKADADDYLAEWRRESVPCGDDLEAEAHAAAKQLEAAYPHLLLTRIADNGGIDLDKAYAPKPD